MDPRGRGKVQERDGGGGEEKVYLRTKWIWMVRIVGFN